MRKIIAILAAILAVTAVATALYRSPARADSQPTPQVGSAFILAQTGQQGPLLAHPARETYRGQLPGWLSWSYQRGTHHRCVVVWNNTPRGDTSVRMCKGGQVDTS